jgi:hypothetical protein
MKPCTARGIHVPFAILALFLAAMLSAPTFADARNRDHAPKNLWQTYPLDPSGGAARIRPSARDANDSSPPRTEKAAPPTTSTGRGGTAHFAQEHSPGGERLSMIAAALVAGGLLCGLILIRRPALRIVRNVGDDLPMATIVLSASVVFVSVIIGIGVVLLISPMLGP